MPADRDSPTSVLSRELAHALDRSLETSLRSLASLRRAVRTYATHARHSGMTLVELHHAAAGILSEAEDEKAELADAPATRDAELARLLREWCQYDYHGSL